MTLLVILDWIPKGYTVGARKGKAWAAYRRDRERLRGALLDAARAQGWPVVARQDHPPVRIGVAVWVQECKTTGELSANGGDWTNIHKGIEDALTRDPGKGAARWPGLLWDDSPRYVRGPTSRVPVPDTMVWPRPGVYVAADGLERCVIYVEEVER